MANNSQSVIFYLYCKVGRFIPWGIRNYCIKILYKRGSAKPRTLTVDLSGSCNLRCPSCPVGSLGQIHPSGFMDKELFRKTLKKARTQHGIHVVALHNWTEPFLHPDLPEFIRMVKEEGFICAISSNMTIRRNIEEVLAAGPDFFRISLSGFTQESYRTTHVRGNIEHVKENMRMVSEALKRGRKNRTCVTVFYHKYQHNLEEMPQMRAYAHELGFAWEESWAYYMSLEKVTQLMEGKLSAEENDFVQNRLALPISEAITAAKQLKGHQRCSLLEDQIVLDYRGNVNLCCAVYDYEKNRLGNFMEMDEAMLKNAKTNHSTCRRCTKDNLHLYFTYHDIPTLSAQYDRLAKDRLPS